MKSLHFGAGKIGRGFIGAQLSLAGCDVTFVDVNSDVVNAINRQRGYALHILNREPFVQSISGVSAALVADTVREVCGIDNPLVLAQIEEQYGAF